MTLVDNIEGPGAIELAVQLLVKLELICDWCELDFEDTLILDLSCDELNGLAVVLAKLVSVAGVHVGDLTTCALIRFLN